MLCLMKLKLTYLDFCVLTELFQENVKYNSDTSIR